MITLVEHATAGYSPYVDFTREQWARLSCSTPLMLSEQELAQLRGLNERVSLAEVADIYLPLSALLNLYISSAQQLHRDTAAFFGRQGRKVPYVIGIAGSVAVGKSTTARIMRALLARWPNHRRVDIVTTDGFLYPNAVLEARGLMNRKGFPESYDVRRLIRFMADLKSGRDVVTAPVYSHLSYDIVPGQEQVVRQPDVVIVEGLNVLQTTSTSQPGPQVFVSDFFDFSIYVDADEEHIKAWYIDRFLTLRETVFQDPNSYFHRYASLTLDEAKATARRIWDQINGVNLRENIASTRTRASLILRKGADHALVGVKLRKI